MKCHRLDQGIPEEVPETDQLSRYRTISTLGAGGMAIVVLAEDTLLGRQVALKRMTVAGDPRQGLRLRREALIGASISHANLVSVYDVFTGPDGDLTVVMEYVEGETLARRLDREGRSAGAEAIRLLRGVAAALDAIHDKGIVHRDVKPPNILLGRAGVVKLADLGVASVPDYTRITSSGAVVGSLRYMAPEQVENGPSTKAIDVYALSAVAFEMLSGRKARLEENPLALAHAIANQPPPDLREAWPQAPAPAAELLERAMARDPRQRPSSAGEFVDTLGKILAPPGASRPARRAAPSPARPVVAPSPASPVGSSSPARQADSRPGRPVVAPSPASPVGAPRPARKADSGPARPAIQPATATTRAGAPAARRHRKYPAQPPPPRSQRSAPDGGPGPRRWVPAAALLLVLVVAGALVAILSSSSGNSNAGGPAVASGRSHHHGGSAKSSGSAGSGSTGASAGNGSTSGSAGSGSTSGSAGSGSTNGSAGGGSTSGSAGSGSTAASSPPAGATTGGASTPIAAVESFYSLGAAHRYGAAWSLADLAFRSQLGSYEGFAGGQQQVKSVRFDAAHVVSQSGSTATVSLRTTSTHIDGLHQCSGTVDVVRNGTAGTWLLHRININCT